MAKTVEGARMKETVLSILENVSPEYISGEDIAARLFMTRANVWKEIRKLRRAGYDISASTRRGYSLSAATDFLSEHSIVKYCAHSPISGMTILSSVDSTNTFANLLAQQNPDLSDHVVFSEAQSKGKGRRERSFFSPAGKGIYMSILLRPKEMEITDVQLLTICAAVAVCEAISSVCSVSPSIKWLNDIYIGGKKVCGILTEGDIEPDLLRYRYVTVGIGVNVQLPDSGIPEEISGIYTALSEWSPALINRNRLAAEILCSFYRMYDNLRVGGAAAVREDIIGEYKTRSMVLGRFVSQVGVPERLYRAVDISSQGHLVVEDSLGTRTSWSAGEISICPEALGTEHSYGEPDSKRDEVVS